VRSTHRTIKKCQKLWVRQQITVASIHWLCCEIIEIERVDDQFSDIPKLEVFFPHLYIGIFQHEELPASAYGALLRQYG